MLEFGKGEATTLQRLVRSFIVAFERDVVDVLAKELRGIQPARVVEVREELTLLLRQLELKPKQTTLHDVHRPLLKRILVDERRRAAEAVEEPLGKSLQPEVARLLQRDILPIEGLMKAPWFAETQAARLPRLTDYMSIRFAEAALGATSELAPRVFDEKFHILEAPTSFFGDLRYYRRKCMLRDAPLIVAYADIDDFKSLNTKLTETVVDLKILGPFMEHLEATTFGHGHVYRYGGDEYVLLLPNMDQTWGAAFLTRLGQGVAKKDFGGLRARLTLSFGFVVVEPDCFLTDREVLLRSNLAKSLAKSHAKGSLCGIAGPRYDERDASFDSLRPPKSS